MNDFHNRNILVLVPHQDDEVIGMGGLVAKACREAACVRIVLFTDGAATGSVKPLKGIVPCSKFSSLLDYTHEELRKHDASLIEKEGSLYHSERLEPVFDLREDHERAGGLASVAWGKQRDREFRAVCRVLGIENENIILACSDPESPHWIKDGQISVDGKAFSNHERKARYREVAEHYISIFSPDLVFTMAPYEFSEPPNDHWAIAEGVREASKRYTVNNVLYFHSGRHYMHVKGGGTSVGSIHMLEEDIWEIKKEAITQYLKWDPGNGWFATAMHSVPAVLATLLQGHGQKEYFSTNIQPSE